VVCRPIVRIGICTFSVPADLALISVRFSEARLPIANGKLQ
jgi:hypothetical protein